MAVEPKTAIKRILADLNLAVRYGIAIRIYASRKFLADFNLAVVIIDRQTAKFNSLPNFPARRYPLGLITCTRREVTLLDAYVLHGAYSVFNTLLFSIIKFYSWSYLYMYVILCINFN